MRNVDRPEPLEDMLAGLQHRAEARALRVLEVPHADVALTRTHEPTEAPPTRRGRTSTYTSDVLMDNHAFRAVNEVGAAIPAHDSAARSVRPRSPHSASASAGRTRSSRRRGSCASRRWSTRSRANMRSRRCAPRGRSSSATRSRSRSSCGSSAADDALLSPAYGRDVAYVAVHVFKGMAFEAPFREVEAPMAEFAAARPGANARTWAPPSSRRATRAGTTSRRFAPSSTPRAASPTRRLRHVLG